MVSEWFPCKSGLGIQNGDITSETKAPRKRNMGEKCGEYVELWQGQKNNTEVGWADYHKQATAGCAHLGLPENESVPSVENPCIFCLVEKGKQRQKYRETTTTKKEQEHEPGAMNLICNHEYFCRTKELLDDLVLNFCMILIRRATEAVFTWTCNCEWWLGRSKHTIVKRRSSQLATAEHP